MASPEASGQSTLTPGYTDRDLSVPRVGRSGEGLFTNARAPLGHDPRRGNRPAERIAASHPAGAGSVAGQFPRGSAMGVHLFKQQSAGTGA